jgi:hypothetical protein
MFIDAAALDLNAGRCVARESGAVPKPPARPVFF